MAPPATPATKGTPGKGNTPGASPGKCAEGWVHVIGPLCAPGTTIKKVKKTLPDFSIWGEMEYDISCQTAIAALQAAVSNMEQILKMPSAMLKLAQLLLNKPFNEAQKLMQSALGILDDINELLNGFIGGPVGALQRLKSALERILSCPLLADTPIGKAAANALDALDAGRDVTGALMAMKGLISDAFTSQLNDIKKTPAAALARLNSLLNDTLARFGANELLSQLQGLEECVKAVCKLAQEGGKEWDKLPKTSEDLKKAWNLHWDETKNRTMAKISGYSTAIQRGAEGVVTTAGNLVGGKP